MQAFRDFLHTIDAPAAQQRNIFVGISSLPSPPSRPSRPAELYVVVLEARNLPCFDANLPGPVHPRTYVTCRLAESYHSTTISAPTINPIFNQSLSLGTIDLSLREVNLEVCINDKNPLASDELLGSFEMNVKDCFSGEQIFTGVDVSSPTCVAVRDLWCSLGGVSQGEVHLILIVKPWSNCDSFCQTPPRSLSPGDFSAEALACAERVRFSNRSRWKLKSDDDKSRPLALDADKSSLQIISHASKMPIYRGLSRLEERQFWRWQQTLSKNAWLLDEESPRDTFTAHASASYEPLVNTKRAGKPTHHLGSGNEGGSNARQLAATLLAATVLKADRSSKIGESELTTLIKGGLPSQATGERMLQKCIVVEGDAGIESKTTRTANKCQSQVLLDSHHRRYSCMLSTRVNGWRLIGNSYALYRVDVTLTSSPPQPVRTSIDEQQQQQQQRGDCKVTRLRVWRRYSEFVELAAQLKLGDFHNALGLGNALTTPPSKSSPRLLSDDSDEAIAVEMSSVEAAATSETSPTASSVLSGVFHHITGSLDPAFLNHRRTMLDAFLSHAVGLLAPTTLPPTQPSTAADPYRNLKHRQGPRQGSIQQHGNHQIKEVSASGTEFSECPIPSSLSAGDVAGETKSGPKEKAGAAAAAAAAAAVSEKNERQEFTEFLHEFLGVLAVPSSQHRPLLNLRRCLWLRMSGASHAKAQALNSVSQSLSFAELRVASDTTATIVSPCHFFKPSHNSNNNGVAEDQDNVDDSGCSSGARANEACAAVGAEAFSARQSMRGREVWVTALGQSGAVWDTTFAEAFKEIDLDVERTAVEEPAAVVLATSFSDHDFQSSNAVSSSEDDNNNGGEDIGGCGGCSGGLANMDNGDYKKENKHDDDVDFDPLNMLGSSHISPRKEVAEKEKESLRRVLRAASLALPDVGYCQAMNFVALFLLRHAFPPQTTQASLQSKLTGVDDHVGKVAGSRGEVGHEEQQAAVVGDGDDTDDREEDSFWLLVALCRYVVPRHFTRNMAGAQLDLLVFKHLLETHLPDLPAHASANLGAPLELVASEWILCLLAVPDDGVFLPPHTTLRVWDWMLLEGSDVILYVLLALFRRAASLVLSSRDLVECLHALRGVAAEQFVDAQLLIDLAREEQHRVGGAAQLSSLRAAIEESLRSSSMAAWARQQRKDTAQQVAYMLQGRPRRQHLSSVSPSPLPSPTPVEMSVPKDIEEENNQKISAGEALNDLPRDEALSSLRKEILAAVMESEREGLMMGLGTARQLKDAMVGEDDAEKGTMGGGKGAGGWLRSRLTIASLRLIGRLPPLTIDARVLTRLVTAAAASAAATTNTTATTSKLPDGVRCRLPHAPGVGETAAALEAMCGACLQFFVVPGSDELVDAGSFLAALVTLSPRAPPKPSVSSSSKCVEDTSQCMRECALECFHIVCAIERVESLAGRDGDGEGATGAGNVGNDVTFCEGGKNTVALSHALHFLRNTIGILCPDLADEAQTHIVLAAANKLMVRIRAAPKNGDRFQEKTLTQRQQHEAEEELAGKLATGRAAAETINDDVDVEVQSIAGFLFEGYDDQRVFAQGRAFVDVISTAMAEKDKYVEGLRDGNNDIGKDSAKANKSENSDHLYSNEKAGDKQSIAGDLFGSAIDDQRLFTQASTLVGAIESNFELGLSRLEESRVRGEAIGEALLNKSEALLVKSLVSLEEDANRMEASIEQSFTKTSESMSNALKVQVDRAVHNAVSGLGVGEGGRGAVLGSSLSSPVSLFEGSDVRLDANEFLILALESQPLLRRCFQIGIKATPLQRIQRPNE